MARFEELDVWKKIATAYVGLLCTGKSGFDAIESHRQDRFFADALGLSGVPAASTLRMQLDALADKLMPYIISVERIGIEKGL